MTSSPTSSAPPTKEPRHPRSPTSDLGTSARGLLALNVFMGVADERRDQVKDEESGALGTICHADDPLASYSVSRAAYPLSRLVPARPGPTQFLSASCAPPAVPPPRCPGFF